MTKEEQKAYRKAVDDFLNALREKRDIFELDYLSGEYARWIFWEDDVLMIAMKLKEATWERKIN